MGSTATLFGRVPRAKNLGQLLEQESRLRRLLLETTKVAISRADARITTCHLHYAHNWGNEAAKEASARHESRQHLLNRLLRPRLARAKPSWA